MQWSDPKPQSDVSFHSLCFISVSMHILHFLDFSHVRTLLHVKSLPQMSTELISQLRVHVHLIIELYIQWQY